MPAGCLIMNSSGTVILSALDVVGSLRIFGSVSCGTANGSVTDARYQEVADGKSRFAFFLTLNDTSGKLWERPTVSFSGHTVSWSWVYAERPPWTLTYGVY